MSSETLSLLSPLALAQRHVDGARRIVAAQELIVAALKEKGADAATAEDVLASFKRTLAQFENDLARLSARSGSDGNTATVR